MSSRKIRCVIVVSTAGSVMNEALKNPFFKGTVHSVVSDRECPAIEKAQSHGVRTESFLEHDEEEFSSRLLKYLVKNNLDYVFSFYTGFFGRCLRDVYKDRGINLHPSLLPAFKGMTGFDDAVAYGVRFVGSTVEFVDEKMDEGKVIMQTVCPLDTTQQLAYIRHRIFVQQCKSLLQVAKWLAEDRIKITGRHVTVLNSKFGDSEFSPSLDFEDAIRFQAPTLSWQYERPKC
jgi:phosphoribosylglycinamide formyltransferase-1